MRRSLTTFIAALTTVGALVVPATASSATDLDAPSTTYAASIGAVEAWAQGHTGEGVGIALIDTGVDPVPGLEDRIAARFDVSGAPNLTDGHGHGTFLAGLMVGGDGPDGAPLGVAPGAHVVSIKVADMNGDTTLDRVLSGLAVARATRGAYNTRVIVLALGGPADELIDPLEEALQDLWADGFVVVVPSGNQADMVVEPGVSPYLLTVGATDDAGTADPADDTVAPWSATGAARAADGTLTGAAKPEVLAPGVSLVSTRMPGSTADIENPDSRIDGKWFRGSGTSMAAAVAAGAAALLIDADSSLTPDQVKGRLAASARSMSTAGAGAIDVPAALQSDALANVGLPALEVSEPEQPTDGWTGTDFTGRSWIGRSWIGRSWIDDEWNGRSWIGRSWIGRSWIDAEWDGRSWIGRSWIGRSWIELEWDGRSWIGRSWIDHEWEGRSWIGRSWIGRSWIGRSWIGADWTAGSWLRAGWS